MSPPRVAALAALRQRSATSSRQKRNVAIVWILLGAVVVAAALLSPYFLTPVNINNLFEQAATLLLVTIGQTCLVITGGIDFSVGSMIGLAATVLALIVAPDPISIVISIVVVLLLGALVGVANGLTVTKLGVPPFIATLASSSIVFGVALQLRKTPPGTLPREYASLFTGLIGPVSISLAFIVVATISVGLLLRHTRFGRHFYAIGDNPAAAALSGVDVNRLRVAAYAFTAVMAALAGAFFAARTRAGDPLLSSSFAFDSVTAVVMGGVSIWGGRGSVFGAAAAVLIIAIVGNVLNLLGLPSDFQSLIRGGMLIGAVMLYHERD
jgi:ribose transport system permease protein